MQLAFVQSTPATLIGSVGPLTTSGITTTPKNLLVLAVGLASVGAAINGVSDTQGNTWTRAFADVSGSLSSLSCWYTWLKSGGAGHTVTITGDGFTYDWAVILQEFSGTVGNKVEITKTATGTSAAAASGNTANATQQSYELIVGVGVNDLQKTFTVGAGYSNLGQTGVNTTIQTAIQSQIVTTTGVQSSSMALANTGWCAAVLAFYASINTSPGSSLRPAIFKGGIAR